MSAWLVDLNRGLRSLSRHDPQQAARWLGDALRQCPTTRPAELHRICLYLGVALKRLGHTETAIRSWVSCQRLRKRGPMRRLLIRFMNQYGMEKQERQEIDDWKAFASIQLSRYLRSKNKRAFATVAEQDMVVDLIRDHWRQIRKDGRLEGLSCAQKHELFSRLRIVFPTVVIPGSPDGPGGTSGASIIAVNFQSRRRVGLMDRCFCGSGLPFSLCCGRTPGCAEVLSGLF
jgi:hypothetical protein